ncbi:hypothetical protein ZWY2020_029402 [Hordeum vulgare]|nr:hypothetical protein ZWY2020_029398 [Hordeum vulgare]KAI4994354.1 hypothetical protein ZWY2020_029402 [Hordeum vulgare]
MVWGRTAHPAAGDHDRRASTRLTRTPVIFPVILITSGMTDSGGGRRGTVAELFTEHSLASNVFLALSVRSLPSACTRRAKDEETRVASLQAGGKADPCIMHKSTSRWRAVQSRGGTRGAA